MTGFLDRVVSREAWGADESLRFKDGTVVWPTAFVAPSLLVVHHTAGNGDITDAEAAAWASLSAASWFGASTITAAMPW